MSDEEPYDYEAARRAASELWLREQIAARLERFHAERPPVFAAPGELHADIAAWVKRCLDGEAANLILVGNVGVGKSWSLWKIKETLIGAGWLRSIEIRAAHELKRTCAPPGAGRHRFDPGVRLGRRQPDGSGRRPVEASAAHGHHLEQPQAA
jgi:DNA replication protein DnaC